MVDLVLAMPPRTRLHLLAPIVRGRKGEHRKDLADLLKRGFQRVKIDGELHQIEDAPALDKKRKHTIEVVVDRLVVAPDVAGRLADSLETALEAGDGLAVAEDADGGRRTLFSARFACPVSGFTIEEIEPRLFSFNNPFGACPTCDGLGTRLYIDADLVVPDPGRSLDGGAIAPWANSSSRFYAQTLASLAKHYRFSTAVPFRNLPEEARDVILYGSGDERVPLTYDDGRRSYTTRRPLRGPGAQHGAALEGNRFRLDPRGARTRYQATAPCAACDGYRLKPEALAVKIDSLHVGQVAEMSIGAAQRWCGGLEGALTPKQREIARRILRELQSRLGFLVDVGLEYLTLSRAAGSLSGGESQRIRLASQIGSGLTGVLYVLDEPSIGLHQRDNARLLETLKRLRDLGNSVLVVEHDEEAIEAADHVIDMGPGAGIHGGRVVAEGPPRAIAACAESLTGRYLKGAEQVPMPMVRRSGRKGMSLTVVGASEHNLKDLTARIPLGTPHLHHRGLGERQIDPRRRHPLPRHRPAPQQRPHRARRPSRDRRARVHRQDRRHRPVADRADAALQSGHLYRRLHADSRLVRRPARSRRPRPTSPGASRSTSRAAAAKPARATASSRSKCTSCPTSTSNAMCARASATTGRRWKYCSKTNRSPMFLT